MKRALKIAKWFFLVWGVISFFAILFSGGCIFYSFTLGNRPTYSASKHDVRFVLNWCKLGNSRIAEVVHGYVSARSFTGDHLDGYAIRVTHLDVSELVYDKGRGGAGWYRGDALSGVAKEAVDFAAMWLGREEMSWFPTIDKIRSSEMYVYIQNVRFSGTQPRAAQIIFANPDDKMIYYFSAQF